MKTKTRISEVWPPVAGKTQNVTVYAHIDGRRVRHIKGPVEENEKQKDLILKRGNIDGTYGSIGYFEAFPNEDVCKGCVAPEEASIILADGTELLKWGTLHPRFDYGFEGHFCPKCLQRKLEELRDGYAKKVSLLTAMALPVIEAKQ